MTIDTTREKIKRMTVCTDSTIRDVLQAIDAGEQGIALLVKPGTRKMVALVTDGDIRRALIHGAELHSPVKDIANYSPKVAHTNTPAEELASFFSDPVRVVPVINDEGEVIDLAQFDKRMHIPVAEPSLGDRELKYLSECVLSGWISSNGSFVNRFEQSMADHVGVKYAVSASNGTCALHLAMLALGIGPGDEVIVPSFTFIATANSVTYTGAKCRFVDSETESWNMDPDLIEAAITPKTKAIVPVHIYGHPANMGPILDIARKHNLYIIEDAAEAHGAQYQDRKVGGIGHIGVFSFFGNKIITTGEGGMAVTDDESLAEKMRIFRDHGMSKERRYWHTVIGYNYRMTNMQAAVGVAQMEKLDYILAAKQNIGTLYNRGLNDIPGLVLQPQASWAQPVCWLYSVVVDEEKFGLSRDTLMDMLKARGIDSRPLFPPMHLQPVYKTDQTLPVSESLSRNGLSLPSSITLKTTEIERIINAIREIRFAKHDASCSQPK